MSISALVRRSGALEELRKLQFSLVKRPASTFCIAAFTASCFGTVRWQVRFLGFSAGSWIWTNLKNSTAHTTATSALDCFTSYLFRLSIQHQLLCFQHFSAEVDQLRWKGKRTGSPGNFDWRDLEDRTWRLSKYPNVQASKCEKGASSAAQGGGGSFKNRKPIGEVGCCESRMAERIHWWIDRWLELCFLERLQWLQWPPYHNCWM